MMTAPERIWATEDADNFGEDRFHTTQPMRGLSPYILATPAALSAAPEVQALVEAAVKRAMEAAAWKSTSFLVGDLPNLRNPMAHEIADAIRAIAADPAEVRKIAEGRHE